MPTTPKPEDDTTLFLGAALFNAVVAGNSPLLVLALVDDGVSLDATNANGDPVPRCEHGWKSQDYNWAGSDATAQDAGERTVLLVPVEREQQDLLAISSGSGRDGCGKSGVTILQGRERDIESGNQEGYTTLEQADWSGDRDAVRSQLELGADVNFQDHLDGRRKRPH